MNSWGMDIDSTKDFYLMVNEEGNAVVYYPYASVGGEQTSYSVAVHYAWQAC